MMNQPDDIILSAVLLILFGCCTLFTVQKSSEKITDAVRSSLTLRFYFFKQAAGILLFGFIPLMFSSSLHSYLQLPVMNTPVVTAFVLLAIIVTVAGIYLAGTYLPGTAAVHFRDRQLLLFFVLRTAFIISYELFFRGAFLLALLAILPAGISILINTAAYALLHAGSGKKEFAGAVPFGTVLCFICIASSSIWLAVVLHLLLALSYETIAVRKLSFHPHKTFV